MCNCWNKKFLMIGLALAVLVALALTMIPVKGPETPSPEVTLPTETTAPPQTEPAPTEPPETEPPVTEPPIPEINVPTVVTAPEGFSEAMDGELIDQQNWFFDFAIAYRLDYMPAFAEEDGAPTDSWEYLYWAFTVNYEAFAAEPAYWPKGRAIMDTKYVEAIVSRHFGVTITDHRSHRKSWSFDPETNIYTAYPEGLREPPTYLLTGIEYDPEQGLVTVRADGYECQYLYGTEELERLRQELLYGEKTDMSVRYQIVVKFRLDPETQEALFLSLERKDLMYPE